MENKVGRNDPCPCGSGKKYKQCCINKPFGARKLQAKWLNPKTQVTNLMDRTFGSAIKQASQSEAPPIPTAPPPAKVEEKSE